MAAEQAGPIPLADAPPPQPAPLPNGSGPVAVASQLINGVDLEPYVKALIYGEPGSGKTVFAARSPKPLIIDVENSTEALRDWPELSAEAKIIRLQTWNDLDEIIMAIRAGDPAYADRETLVIDTISELQRRNLDEILIGKAKADSSYDPFLAYELDYKKSGEMLRRITTAFRDLPMHLIVLAHMREDEQGARKFVRPDVTPKLAQTLRGVFGLQGFLFVTEEGWEGDFANMLQTRRNASVEAKSRYRHLAPLVENPSFEKVIEASHLYLQDEADAGNNTTTKEQAK